jgi:hypothetical protein
MLSVLFLTASMSLLQVNMYVRLLPKVMVYQELNSYANACGSIPVLNWPGCYNIDGETTGALLVHYRLAKHALLQAVPTEW